MTSLTTLDPAAVEEAVEAEFAGGRDYLAACTVGLPTRSSRAAIFADLEASAVGRPDIAAYCRAVEDSRAAFARLVRVPVDRVAIGAQVSALAAVVATGVPEGAEVLVPAGEFSSIALPFVHAGRGIRVREAPLDRMADAIRPATALVAFSLVQSATGEVADADAIVQAARDNGVPTLCDVTQAAGWMPVDASRFDAVVCHAYKWLCAPRGVAFLAVSHEFERRLRSILAGWYAGDDPWASCYGTAAVLATGARRLDVSPAWQAFTGAAPALELFASLDPAATQRHATRLATLFRQRLHLALPPRASAIVTWDDPDGRALARLTAAGIVASGRAGRARVAFHVFNDDEDVDRAARALGC